MRDLLVPDPTQPGAPPTRQTVLKYGDISTGAPAFFNNVDNPPVPYMLAADKAYVQHKCRYSGCPVVHLPGAQPGMVPTNHTAFVTAMRHATMPAMCMKPFAEPAKLLPGSIDAFHPTALALPGCMLIYPTLDDVCLSLIHI